MWRPGKAPLGRGSSYCKAPKTTSSVAVAVAEGAAGAHEQLALAAIETPDLDHQGGGSHLERFRDSAVESDLSFEK